jgi:AcrR family transcriptional regulator
MYKGNLMSESSQNAPERAGRAPRPADRRQEIIAAAIQVIARDGIRACTVSALEHETGFARGHFTYHFQAKEEIISLAFATVASDWATTQMETTIGDTGRERLEHRVRAAVTWTQKHPDYFRCLMNFRVEMMRHPDAFPPSAAIHHQFWEFGAQMIRDGITEGSFRPDVDPAIAIRTVFAIVDGMVLDAAMDPEFCPSEELADRTWSVITQHLDVAPPAPLP